MTRIGEIVYSLSASTTDYETIVHLNHKDFIIIGGDSAEINWELLLELADAYRSTL